jgi:3-methyladenine DNA glycosylase AlkD
VPQVTVSEIMLQLERCGTEQNRKIYRRHGAAEPLYGVSFANLRALAKRIRVDQALADGLWATGNADARLLATMIAEPARFGSRKLDAWLKGLTYYALVDSFAHGIVSRSRFARERAERWSASADEWVGRAGWIVVGDLAAADDGLPNAYFEEKLGVIEAAVHSAPNRTRDAMNAALINIGARNEALRERALGVAERIGTVAVDHGETGCKTPAAGPYIEKMWARREGVAQSKRGAGV